jgi:hypothetical protein
MSEASDAYEMNIRAIRDLRNKGTVLLLLPGKMAEFYAIGGPGVGQGVVGDRFQGEGNARFAPLSSKYLLWKTGRSKDLNKKQKASFGRGSRLLKYKTGTSKRETYEHKLLREEAKKRSAQGGSYDSWYQQLKKEWKVAASHETKDRFSSVLPILVLSGKLREAVTSRAHTITSSGDTAVITFKNLPEYALAHHKPITAPFPKRSPVEPDAADVDRLWSFATTWLSAQLGVKSAKPVAFGGQQARIIP